MVTQQVSKQTMREYQQIALDQISAEWAKGIRSTLCVMPTGVGKGSCIAELCTRNRPERTLVLVHRRELAKQMVARLNQFGIYAEMEMGAFRARRGHNSAVVIVAMVQSLISGSEENWRRMDKFRPAEFSLLIGDEIHHATSRSWLTVIKHFMDGNPALRMVGFTATPDRHDGMALRKVCDSVAVNYEIVHMIEEGWLVDIEQKVCKLESLDFNKVKVTAGDFNGADLDRLLKEKKNLFGISDAIIQTVGNRKTLVFNTSIENAELTAQILNQYKPNCAASISEKTPDSDRKGILTGFSSGDIQFLTNVGIIGEGVDIPAIECVACAAPTMSRSRYAQMVGRGTRPLPGIVDGLPDAQSRINSIKESSKPNVLVLDFTGVNAHRHKLVTAIDILGGATSDEAKDLALRISENESKERNLRETVEAAELRAKAIAEARAARARAQVQGIKAAATVSLHYVDPFDMFRKRAEKWNGYRQYPKLSEKQRKILASRGHDPDSMTFEEAKGTIAAIFGASSKQLAVLSRSGYSTEEINGIARWEASKLIDQLKANGWKRNNASQLAKS